MYWWFNIYPSSNVTCKKLWSSKCKKGISKKIFLIVFHNLILTIVFFLFVFLHLFTCYQKHAKARGCDLTLTSKLCQPINLSSLHLSVHSLTRPRLSSLSLSQGGKATLNDVFTDRQLEANPTSSKGDTGTLWCHKLRSLFSACIRQNGKLSF